MILRMHVTHMQHVRSDATMDARFGFTWIRAIGCGLDALLPARRKLIGVTNFERLRMVES
jgi:hypothetical protein